MQSIVRAPRAPIAALVRTLTPPGQGRESLTRVVADAMVQEAPHHVQLPNIDLARLPIPASVGAPRVPRDCRDSIETIIPKPRVQPYAHRTFMGLAGSMMRDPVWSAFLQSCMPELHAKCVASGVSIAHLMRLLEGNPVLAAYGLWRGEDKTLPMEWDLWLDPKHPTDLTLARVIHGNSTSTQLAGSPEALVPGVADAIMDGTRADTDVHEGLTPLRWMALFQQAALCGNLPIACSAVYLDVKSSWSSAEDLAGFVHALQNQHVETRGVLAFDFNQLAEPLQVPRAVHLTHSPAGLAMALLSIPHGAAAMFNGGALVDTRVSEPTINPIQLNLVRKLRQARDLRIGVYLQEDAVSPQALRVLIECLNRESDTFSDGIAYGGLAGVAEGLISDGSGTGCQTAAIDLENARYSSDEGL